MIESYNVVYHLHLPLDQIEEVVRAAVPSVSTAGVVTTCARSGVPTSAYSGVPASAHCGVPTSANDCAHSSVPTPTSSSSGGGGGRGDGRGGGAVIGEETKDGAISIEALLNVLSANLELNHVESSILAPTTITV